MPYRFTRKASVFTEPVAARIKELAGVKQAREIARELNLTRGSLHCWAQARGISLAVKRESAVSESAAAVIRRLAGKVLGPLIAARAGVSYGVMRHWARKNGVKLSGPLSDHFPNRRARLRRLAQSVGLGISWQVGQPVTIWVAVREGLTVDEAEMFLSRSNRDHRLDATEAAYDRATTNDIRSLGAAALCPGGYEALERFQMALAPRLNGLSLPPPRLEGCASLRA